MSKLRQYSEHPNCHDRTNDKQCHPEPAHLRAFALFAVAYAALLNDLPQSSSVRPVWNKEEWALALGRVYGNAARASHRLI